MGFQFQHFVFKQAVNLNKRHYILRFHTTRCEGSNIRREFNCVSFTLPNIYGFLFDCQFSGTYFPITDAYLHRLLTMFQYHRKKFKYLLVSRKKILALDCFFIPNEKLNWLGRKASYFGENRKKMRITICLVFLITNQCSCRVIVLPSSCL